MTGVELIAAERRRQIEEEGWTAEHDDRHKHGELAAAAACYAVAETPVYTLRSYSVGGDPRLPQYKLENVWPVGWSPGAWKPKDRLRNLIRAGALIAAEIDRLQRLEGETES